jgi:hypothetical protein
MAVQYAFSQITTTGLKLAVDAADPLSYPGSGTSWTDVTGNGFTGTISSSISFATTNRGALVSSNSASAVSFSGSAADFGQGSFTVEMAFLPSQINGRHWLYSKNSGSFPNFGAFITGSGGSGRLTAFYNVSSTISSSATTAVGSIVTGSNYVLDVTYIPNNIITSVYLNSNYIASGSANGLGSLSTSASLLLLNNTTASNAGSVGNLYNFKVYNPYINSSNIRKNYNSMCSRFGLPLALYTPSAPLLLDSYPGATGAYSLRLLQTSYTGNAIRVRRSSDNTEQDIGFDGNGDLNTGALLLFCGVGNGFVTTWYDQSGNARNATQTTAANQPQIVSSGNVLTINSKPRIDFDGSNDSLSITQFTYEASNYNSFVGQRTSAGSLLMGLAGNQYNFALWSDNNYYLQANTSGYQASTTTDTSTSHLLLTGLRESGGTQRIYKNGNQITSIFIAFSLNQNINSIGLYASSNFSNCRLQEIIYYNSAQENNRTGIESNINSYYGIY